MSPLRLALALALIVGVASPRAALAWGATGHRLIGRVAIESLPGDLPAFLRTPASVEAVGELAREPDRWKDAGREHDSDRDPAHFLNLGDDGKVLGGPALDALPATRADYDAALRAVGADSWKGGYLPYSIIDASQQLAKDFAYWRVDTAALGAVANRGHHAWFAADRLRREALTLRDAGALAHYVGDGSQPLHVSAHFNGWGPYPNPEGFTNDRIHASFEGAFVRRFVTAAKVSADLAPAQDCHCSVAARTAAYLAATNAQTVVFYRLQKAGAFAGDGEARERDFAARRLAAGAGELRDLVIAAWRASADGQVGWPAVKVADVISGRHDPFDSLFGAD